MKAVKARKSGDGARVVKKPKLRTVTFRVTSSQRQALADYALDLSKKARSQVSMNSAMQRLLTELRTVRSARPA